MVHCTCTPREPSTVPVHSRAPSVSGQANPQEKLGPGGLGHAGASLNSSSSVSHWPRLAAQQLALALCSVM